MNARRASHVFTLLLPLALAFLAALTAGCGVEPAEQAVGSDPRDEATPESSAQIVDVSAIYASSSARALCAAEWPRDFAMRSGCEQNAAAGRDAYDALRETYADDQAMMDALDACWHDWTEAGATDFAMVGGCAAEQEAGLLATAR